jgi:hypothetical protein
MWYLGGGTDTGRYNGTNMQYYNDKSPPLCDVFEVPHNGFSIIRIKVEHAGAWMFHCHVAPHHMAGMGFIMLVDPESAPPPPKFFPTNCDSYRSFVFPM